MSPENASLGSKIVVLRYRFIGDTLLTVPFLRELRHQNPESEIHWLVGQDAYDLAVGCPYVDKVMAFEPRRLGFWKAVQHLKAESYTTAYVLKRSFSSALMTLLAGIPSRIGFNTDHRGFLLTQRVPYRYQEAHEAQCLLDHLPLSNETNSEDRRLCLETWIPEVNAKRAQKMLAPFQGPRVVLHATSTNPAKTWPMRHFQALATALVLEHQATVFFLGTPQDKLYYETLCLELPDEVQGRCVNWCGETTLLDSMALLTGMSLVVANDSGMVHMAAATNVPLVALFGPMDPQQWRPLSTNATVLTHPDLTCRPCRMKITCSHQYPCLTELTPERVLQACKAYLTS